MKLTDQSAGLSDVPGFLLSGVGCDIRQKGDLNRLDMALCISKTPCTAAGVFTTNEVFAAPVRLCREILDTKNPLHGFVANSGNANACTGKQGLQNARKMSELACAAAGLEKNSLFVASTGRIGRQLPMGNIEKGIADAAKNLGNSQSHGNAAANAILTSDTHQKTVTVSFETQAGKTVTLAGMAKGAGMIEPHMATMLCFIATDAVIEQSLLQAMLKRCADRSFNCISVDGDMSTNDSVVVLANGHSGEKIEKDSPDATQFENALYAVCDNLAEKIVGDGEKISKIVEVKVGGARDNAAAEKIARAIGNSLLVKSSWAGEDPNWGRLADAAGYARAGLDQDKLDIDYDNVPVLRGGCPVDENLSQWKQIVKKRRFSILVNLNVGAGEFRLLSTDLTEAYVTFNKSE